MKTQYKFGAILLIFFLFGSILGYTLAQSGNTFIVSQGVYPHAPSYTIWKEGSIYYAKNAYGAIDYSGTNASLVINNCIDSGVRIILKVGTYELDTPIIIKQANPDLRQGVALEGEMFSEERDDGHSVILKPTANFPTDGYLIDIEMNWWFTMKGITIRNLHLTSYGGGKDAVDVRGISIQQTQDTDLYSMGGLLIENVHVSYVFQGLKLDGQIFYGTFRNIDILLWESGVEGNCGIYAIKTNDVQIVRTQHCVFEDIVIRAYDWYDLVHTLLYLNDMTYSQFTDITLQSGNMTGQVIYMGEACIHNSFSNVMVMDVHGAGDGVIVFNGTASRNNVFQPIYCAETIDEATVPAFKFINGAGSNFIQWMPFAMQEWLINATGGNQTYPFLNRIEILPPNQGYWSDNDDTPILHVEGNVWLSGYGVENRGNASVSNNDWIAHKLWTLTPNIILLTPRSNVDVWTNDRNATYFQVGVSAGTIMVDWEVSYSGY